MGPRGPPGEWDVAKMRSVARLVYQELLQQQEEEKEAGEKQKKTGAQPSKE